MLRTLTIRDFAIVERAELELGSGFTALTGETGAGKSILIDAIGLLLGDRSDASMVREGQDKAELQACFDVVPAAAAFLQAQEIDQDDDEIHLRRTIDRQGRSRCWINGQSAGVTQLRLLGETLVEIHGQHEHQLLLREASQREVLDQHGEHAAALAAVQQAHAELKAINQQLDDLEQHREQREAQRERLTWIVDDLGALAPQAGEWDSVQAEQKRLASSADLLAAAQAATQQLTEADESLQSQLGQLQHRLRPWVTIEPRLASALEALEAADIQIQEADSALTNFLAKADLDPERLATVTERLDALHAAARRFRTQPTDLAQLLADSEQQLAQLGATQDQAQLRAQQAVAQSRYLEAARELTRLRTETADALSNAVTQAMQGLGMQGGRFLVTVSPAHDSAHGSDHIEFLVAGHAGSSPKPIIKVASGGELSRISLALAVVAAQARGDHTLIFDEVDSGVGGAVGITVGELLQQLGARRQVVCITHLGQVAAHAHHHLKVTKRRNPIDPDRPSDSGATHSALNQLSKDERIVELARMLGGDEQSEAGLNHARALFQSAHR